MPMVPQLRNPDQGVIHSPLKKANLSLRLKKKSLIGKSIDSLIFLFPMASIKRIKTIVLVIIASINC